MEIESSVTSAPTGVEGVEAETAHGSGEVEDDRDTLGEALGVEERGVEVWDMVAKSEEREGCVSKGWSKGNLLRRQYVRPRLFRL